MKFFVTPFGMLIVDNSLQPSKTDAPIVVNPSINVTCENPLNEFVPIHTNDLVTISFKITSIDEHPSNAFVPIVHFELNVIPSTLLNILQMHLFQLVQLLSRHLFEVVDYSQMHFFSCCHNKCSLFVFDKQQ